MSKMITALAVMAGLVCLATPAHAAQSAGTSCPPGSSGYILWDVSIEPYGADNAVDAQGNSDGLVCARPGKVVTDDEGNPFQLYNFIDNRAVVR